MKTVKQFEEKYKDFVPQMSMVKCLDDFLSCIDVVLDDTDEYQQDYENELKENKMWSISAKIRNFFFFIFQEEEEDFYGEDNKILEDCISYMELLRSFFQRMQQIASEKNYQELTKLMDFINDCYNSQIDYYLFLRDQLEMRMRGFQLSNSAYEDTRESFIEFINQKLEELEKEAKPKEKSKMLEKGTK